MNTHTEQGVRVFHRASARTSSVNDDTLPPMVKAGRGPLLPVNASALRPER